jgi:hypothetical protein
MADKNKTPLGQIKLVEALPRFSSLFSVPGIKRAFDTYYMRYVKTSSGAVFWHFWSTFAILGYAAQRTKHHAQHPHKYANK